MNFALTRELEPVDRLVHSKYSALRKCCGCIHLRAGGAVSCLVWTGLSFYFAILAFMNESPFYSYFDNTPLMVFGALNLIFALVALFGLGALFLNRPWYIRNLSHAIWSSIFVVLVDIIINVILFIINRPGYNTACIGDAANRMGRSVQAAFPNGTSVNLNFTTNSDFYNCDKMWQDELKFSILSVIVIFVLYVYWAACIWSFSHKSALRLRNELELQLQNAAPPPPPPMAPEFAPPPPQGPPGGPPGPGMGGPGMGPGMGGPGMGPGIIQVPSMGGNPNRGNIIVLNNEKPSKKDKAYNLKNLSSRSVNTLNDPPSRRDSGVITENKKPFFGFKIGADGQVIELDEKDVDMELGYAASIAASRSPDRPRSRPSSSRPGSANFSTDDLTLVDGRNSRIGTPRRSSRKPINEEEYPPEYRRSRDYDDEDDEESLR